MAAAASWYHVSFHSGFLLPLPPLLRPIFSLRDCDEPLSRAWTFFFEECMVAGEAHSCRKEASHDKSWLRNLVILGATGCVLSLSGCIMPAIDAGHEGVLVTKPILFGHGGVEPVPATTGRAMVAPTTEVIDVDIRPVQHSEHFEIISAKMPRCRSTRFSLPMFSRDVLQN